MSENPLLAYGMMQDELEIWNALAGIAGKFLQLPELHPMERHEVSHEFHALQNRLLARVGLRVVGWPR